MKPRYAVTAGTKRRVNPGLTGAGPKPRVVKGEVMLHQFDLLTIDLTMFDGSGAPAGASGAAPAAGEGSAPAAAEVTAPEVRYGK